MSNGPVIDNRRRNLLPLAIVLLVLGALSIGSFWLWPTFFTNHADSRPDQPQSVLHQLQKAGDLIEPGCNAEAVLIQGKFAKDAEGGIVQAEVTLAKNGGWDVTWNNNHLPPWRVTRLTFAVHDAPMGGAQDIDKTVTSTHVDPKYDLYMCLVGTK